MSNTVLVTGGSGFVAGWCIVELLRRGYTVRASVRSREREARARAALATVVDPADRLTYVTADLTSDDGWSAACEGCEYVLHVASPLGGASGDGSALIGPARDGTLRVLKAATNAGVRRVVLTSSAAASTPPPRRGAYTANESVWTDPAGAYLDAYRRSKVLAERAAWDFMREHNGATTLTTILPAAIFGPVLSIENLGSVQIIQRLLHGRPPAIPRIGFCVVDVRDLAELHVRAMTADVAAGERLLASGEFLWLKDVAAILRARLGERAARVPTRDMPDMLLRAASWFVPPMRMLTPMIGRELRFSYDKAKRLLDYTPRPAADTIADCAESLLRLST